MQKKHKNAKSTGGKEVNVFKKEESIKLKNQPENKSEEEKEGEKQKWKIVKYNKRRHLHLCPAAPSDLLLGLNSELNPGVPV